MDPDICELCNTAYDYMLEGWMRRQGKKGESLQNSAEMLSDEEFDAAMEVVHRNGLRLRSVKNIRSFSGYPAEGRHVQLGTVLRSGALSKLTQEDAQRLREMGLPLVIDLRMPDEVRKNPDVPIPGVRYENIPLTQELNMERMEALTERYRKSETESERTWYLSEYARIDEVRRMYTNISVDRNSRKAIRRIFQRILEEKGTVLFHCTSGKDRTGIISALFLYALGCDKQDIIKDYNASALEFMALVESMKADLKEHGYGAELQAGVQTILGVVPEVIAAGFYYISSNYASDEALLMEAIGFDHAQLHKLRDKYLE